jgi:hypothetical protein
VLAHLFFNAGDDVTRRRGRHQEAGDALLAGGLVGDGEDDGDLGVLAGGDELLDAVEHEIVAVAVARVVIAEASEPVCGSVRQKQPSLSPRASGFSHFPSGRRCRISW